MLARQRRPVIGEDLVISQSEAANDVDAVHHDELDGIASRLHRNQNDAT